MIDTTTHDITITGREGYIRSLSDTGGKLSLNQGFTIPGYDGTYYITSFGAVYIYTFGFDSIDLSTTAIDGEGTEHGLQYILSSSFVVDGDCGQSLVLPHTLTTVQGQSQWGSPFDFGEINNHLDLTLNWSDDELQYITLMSDWLNVDHTQIYIDCPNGTKDAYETALSDILQLDGAQILEWLEVWENASNIFGTDCTGQVYVDYESTLKKVKIIPSSSGAANLEGTSLVLNSNITIQGTDGYTLTQIATNSIQNSSYSIQTIDLSAATESLEINDGAFVGMEGVNSLVMPSIVFTVGTNCFDGIFTNQGYGTLTLQWSISQINSISFPTNWITNDSSVLNEKTICNIPSRTYSAYDALRSTLSIYEVTLADPEPPLDASVFFTSSSIINGKVDFLADQENYTISIIDGQDVSGTNLKFKKNVQLESPYKPGLYSVDEIGDEAFKSNTNIYGTLDLSDEGTDNAKEPVHLGDGCFTKCTNLSEIILPDSLGQDPEGEDWGALSFGYCTNLTYVHLPKNANVIAYEAFLGCTNLSKANWNELTSLIYIQPYAFQSTNFASIDLSNSKSLLYLLEGAFAECPNLQSVSCPPYIHIIDVGCFIDCKKLCDFDFTDLTALDTIGESAFASTSISSVDLSNCKSVWYIQQNAFADCQSLKTFIMPDEPVTWTLPFYGKGLDEYWLGDGEDYPLSKIETLSVPENYYDDYLYYFENNLWSLYSWYQLVNPQLTPYTPAPSPTPTPTPSGDDTSLGLTLGLSIGLGISLMGVLVGWIAYAIQANKAKKID